MVKYIISAISIYFFLGFLLFFFQRKILFNVSGVPKKPSEYGLSNVDELQILTSDGINLLAWYSKPKINNPTLLYFHGNSFDIGERSYRIDRYIKKGWGVLLLAWRGYSGNKGYPSESNLYKDGESALHWIKSSTSTKNENIVLYGESLGTGVAVELATRYPFKSVILEAPFTSIADIARKRYKIYPMKHLILDKFDNISKISRVLSPVLIISGKKDEVIPHFHSKKLLSKANHPKSSVFIDEATHNNLYDFGIEKEVIKFNKKLWK
tara:strand:+ start:84 stop:884 length:801 start_codon:yes stop_codon:yes gene_type:complete